MPWTRGRGTCCLYCDAADGRSIPLSVALPLTGNVWQPVMQVQRPAGPEHAHCTGCRPPYKLWRSWLGLSRQRTRLRSMWMLPQRPCSSFRCVRVSRRRAHIDVRPSSLSCVVCIAQHASHLYRCSSTAGPVTLLCMQVACPQARCSCGWQPGTMKLPTASQKHSRCLCWAAGQGTGAGAGPV